MTDTPAPTKDEVEATLLHFDSQLELLGDEPRNHHGGWNVSQVAMIEAQRASKRTATMLRSLLSERDGDYLAKSDYEAAMASMLALVRRLDVAMSGEGASSQAIFCDIVQELEAYIARSKISEREKPKPVEGGEHPYQVLNYRDPDGNYIVSRWGDEAFFIARTMAWAEGIAKRLNDDVSKLTTALQERDAARDKALGEAIQLAVDVAEACEKRRARYAVLGQTKFADAESRAAGTAWRLSTALRALQSTPAMASELTALRAEVERMREALKAASTYLHGEYVERERVPNLWFCNLCDADGNAQTEADVRHTDKCIIGVIDAALSPGGAV